MLRLLTVTALVAAASAQAFTPTCKLAAGAQDELKGYSDLDMSALKKALSTISPSAEAAAGFADAVKESCETFNKVGDAMEAKGDRKWWNCMKNGAVNRLLKGDTLKTLDTAAKKAPAFRTFMNAVEDVCQLSAKAADMDACFKNAAFKELKEVDEEVQKYEPGCYSFDCEAVNVLQRAYRKASRTACKPQAKDLQAFGFAVISARAAYGSEIFCEFVKGAPPRAGTILKGLEKNEDQCKPKPEDGSEETPKPADGSEEVTKPADGSKEVTKPVDGSEETPKPADGSKEVTKPADGSEETPKPADGSKEVSKPTDGSAETPKPEDGSNEGTTKETRNLQPGETTKKPMETTTAGASETTVSTAALMVAVVAVALRQ